MNYAISYVSTASPNLSEKEIHEVLEYSRNWNNSHDITGILLYSEGNFFQVLEGDKQVLTDLFQNISKDQRHYDIIKIFGKEIIENRFDNYQVEFISLDSRYRQEDLQHYFAQADKLNPVIQASVKYILNRFSEGIK